MRQRRTLVIAALGFVLTAGFALAQDSGVQNIIGNVFLQDATPGVGQAGHAHIKGTFRAGQVFVSQATGSTIPVVGNNSATEGTSVGGSFSVASLNGTALRGTATNTGNGVPIGVRGEVRTINGIALVGIGNAGTGVNGSGRIGVMGSVNQGGLAGVFALSQSSAAALLAQCSDPNGLAGRFLGSVELSPALRVRGSGSQKIEVRSDIVNMINPLGASLGFMGYVSGRTNAGRTLVKNTVNDGSIEQTFSADSRPVLQLFNRAGSVQAAMFTDQTEKGVIQADVKNFVQPDPDDLEKDIVYASLEGPEAGAYVRGVGKLVGGVAVVPLPRHFQNVILEDGMTIQLTPRSADSEGLAVVRQSLASFEVRELRRGRGTYEFAWEARASRRGFADYRVSRRWDENIAVTDRSAQFRARVESAEKKYGIKARVAGP